MKKQKKVHTKKANLNQVEFSEELSDGGERNKMAEWQARRNK